MSLTLHLYPKEGWIILKSFFKVSCKNNLRKLFPLEGSYSLTVLFRAMEQFKSHLHHHCFFYLIKPFQIVESIVYIYLLMRYDSCRHFTPWGQEIHYFFCPRPNFSTWQTLTQIKQLFDCTVEHIETTAKRIFFTFSW